MSSKLVIGPIKKGLRTDVTAFNIDNDSFPTLVNAFQWRGRIKRKRGTSLLGRLTRGFVSVTLTQTTTAGTQTIILDILNDTAFLNPTIRSIQPNAALKPGTITIIVGASSWNDALMNGVLSPTGGTAAAGTINYTTGQIVLNFTVPDAGGSSIVVSLQYFPELPVMGLEELILTALLAAAYPGELAFDTRYAYNIDPIFPYAIYDVTFYKNPLVDGTNLPGYVRKTVWTRFHWNGKDYQQFWSTNYKNAFWVTNGITIPFTKTNVGMQYKFITGVTIDAAGPPALATLTILAHGLVKGDFLFINEVGGITGINFQTGYVVSNDPQAANTIQVEFPFATLGGAYTSGGIAQYLTNNADPTKDPIRFYDGDPTGGNPPDPALLSTGTGWVNFSPPLSRLPYSIANTPERQYYLAGARLIIPFRDRLLFLGPVIQTSAADSQIYLEDTIIYSQVGTPYYTASFTGDPSLSTTVFHPILVPQDQTATPTAWWEDQTGFGGYKAAGLDDAIATVVNNEDVLIIGFNHRFARLVYTGNDINPFEFYTINTEMGTQSPFSAITLDRGGIAFGNFGIPICSQTAASRIDLEIPDQIFQLSLPNNGAERVTAQRDYINEWLYFTYPSNKEESNDDTPASLSDFPNQTLQYNYREETWAIFNESFTTYGVFREKTGYTWSNIGLRFPTWLSWSNPWNSGTSTLLTPKVIGGNQQGFILFRDDGTNEAPSLAIKSISGSTITSPNHNLSIDDFIVIQGALGTIGAEVNNKIFSVDNATRDTFDLNPIIGTGTYLGGGTIKKMYIPLIQTKQFPIAWEIGRKARIGGQSYLFTETDNGEIVLQIYLSQNDASPYNFGPVVPAIGSINNTLVYTDILSTAPETYIQVINNLPIGLIGNGVLTTIPLNFFNIFSFANPIVPGTVVITIGTLATFTDDGLGGFTVTGIGVAIGSSINYGTGDVILVFSVAPPATRSKATLQYKIPDIQNPTAESQDQVWHRVNTSLIGDTIQLGFSMSEDQMRDPTFQKQFSEIEIHSIVIDFKPSQSLA